MHISNPSGDDAFAATKNPVTPLSILVLPRIVSNEIRGNDSGLTFYHRRFISLMFIRKFQEIVLVVKAKNFKRRKIWGILKQNKKRKFLERILREKLKLKNLNLEFALMRLLGSFNETLMKVCFEVSLKPH